MNTIVEFGLVIAPAKSRRGIQSIEIGVACCCNWRGRCALSHGIGKVGRDDSGKAHPYMVSFLKVGFVTQTEAGHYELGPLASVELTRLQRMDPVKEASQVIEELAHKPVRAWPSRCGETRTDHRATRGADPAFARQLAYRDGDVTANTATGRLFAAYMPPKSWSVSL